MRFAGIDVAGERHVLAVVDEEGKVQVKPTAFGEDAEGYQKLLEVLGEPDCLVALEATGHYWRNLVAFLVAHDFKVALINPLRTRRFAEEELERTKTDSIDAVGIARFAAQKRPPATALPDQAREDLREMVKLRQRLMADLSERVVQLHRVVDLGFPECTRHVRLGAVMATAILSRYPTAKAFRQVSVRKLAGLRYDGRHRVGEELARALIEAAKTSVGSHHSEPYRLEVKYYCEDIEVLRSRLATLQRDIERRLDQHEVGKLLTTIDRVGPLTAACLVAELGDPARFRDAAALASYVGAIPRLRQSGKRSVTGGSAVPLGNARLRHALWMPTIVAVRVNPWLRAHYQRLVAAGKKPKLALVACMRKLLCAIYSVARNRRAFVPDLRAAVTAPAAIAGGAAGK